MGREKFLKFSEKFPGVMHFCARCGILNRESEGSVVR